MKNSPVEKQQEACRKGKVLHENDLVAQAVQMAKKKSFLAKLIRATMKGILEEPSKSRKRAIRRAKAERRKRNGMM